METPSSAETLPPLSSKEVLVGLIAIVCPLLIVIQVVIFAGFRWAKMEFQLWPQGTEVVWSLSPWVVWLPVFGLGFGTMVWWINRTMPVKRLTKLVIMLSLAVGTTVAVWGLLLTPPPKQVFRPPGSDLDRMFNDPWRQNPYNF